MCVADGDGDAKRHRMRKPVNDELIIENFLIVSAVIYS